MKKILIALLMMIFFVSMYFHEKNLSSIKESPDAMHTYVTTIPKVNHNINQSLAQEQDNLKNAENQAQ